MTPDGTLDARSRPSAVEQWRFFSRDVSRMLESQRSRLFTVWMSRSFWGLLHYRFERFMFLLIGRHYRFLRIMLTPLLNLIQAYSNIEIPYHADVKGGLRVLHPSAGVVISMFAVIGHDVLLVGGNVIGTRKICTFGDIQIGDRCSFGANAVALGPVKIANGVRVAALACVTRDCLQPDVALIGAPASVSIRAEVTDTETRRH